ncbi:MAG TPA: amidohydrolase family protein [Syntrophales bacterium]|nr:amidohydrolase family protein [Syntrophales bacterium]
MSEKVEALDQGRRNFVKASLAGAAIAGSVLAGTGFSGVQSAHAGSKKTFITNAKLIAPDGIIDGVSIAVENQKIAFLTSEKIGPNAGEIIDAKGNYVMPGIIDVHTHVGAFRPFEDDLKSESAAAAAGGVTTFYHYMLEGLGSPTGSMASRIDYYIDAVKRLSTVDIGFHGTCMTETHLEDIKKCADRGLKNHKFFMAYKGDEMRRVGIVGIDLPYLYRGMECIRDIGGMAMVHAENYELMKLFGKRYSNNTFSDFNKSRPPITEAVDADTACRMSREVGVPLYIVHVGCGKVLDIANKFRNQGHPVYLETGPRYLNIDQEGKMCKKPWLAKTTPAYKTPEDMARLWEGIKNNEFNTVATDSACMNEKEHVGDGKIVKMLPSWQEMPTMLPMMLSEGYHKGRMSLNQIADYLCYNPAKLFGIYPQKGSLNPGSDADLIIVDIDKKQRVSGNMSPSYCDFSPYEGWELKGWPVMTMVRGKVVMKDGKVTGNPGWGRAVNLS